MPQIVQKAVAYSFSTLNLRQIFESFTWRGNKTMIPYKDLIISLE